MATNSTSTRCTRHRPSGAGSRTPTGIRESVRASLGKGGGSAWSPGGRREEERGRPGERARAGASGWCVDTGSQLDARSSWPRPSSARADSGLTPLGSRLILCRAIGPARKPLVQVGTVTIKDVCPASGHLLVMHSLIWATMSLHSASHRGRIEWGSFRLPRPSRVLASIDLVTAVWDAAPMRGAGLDAPGDRIGSSSIPFSWAVETPSVGRKSEPSVAVRRPTSPASLSREFGPIVIPPEARHRRTSTRRPGGWSHR